MKKIYRRIIQSTILLLLFSTAFTLSAGNRHNTSSYAEVLGIDFTAESFKDGIYYGEADGFRPDLEVKIEISGGKLVSVEVTDHNEIGRQYWTIPVTVLPKELVKQQTTDLDTVSGATATSYGILAAVENALEKART